MTRSMKTFLIIAGALLGTTVIGGYFVIRKYVAPMVRESQSAATDGKAFALTSDNAGCVTETNSRFKGGNEVSQSMKGMMFLTACLKNSAPTPGFCDGVPSARDMTKSPPWQREQCAKLAPARADMRCPMFLGAVQAYCTRG
jgi:hypothetical protein